MSSSWGVRERARAMTAMIMRSHRFLESRAMRMAYCICGVMSTLVIYGLMQEKIMQSPYGEEKEKFKYSLFIVFCNRLLTCSVCAVIILVRGGEMCPVAPLYKYAGVSLSNVSATSCQYEALKYVSFPVQTLAKCGKMIPVMVWGTYIMQKKYNFRDYLLALFVTAGCTIFFLTATTPGAVSYRSSAESSLWGIFLMVSYLGFDGFTSTFQDKLFKGYDMEIFNQILYVTLCSCGITVTGLLAQGYWFPAVQFLFRHPDCFSDIMLLSLAATTSQFFISYTIQTFGALLFATIMTTRQLISIILSCIWFGHPLSAQQWGGAVLVFGALYYRSYLNSRKHQQNNSERSSSQSAKGNGEAEQMHILKVEEDGAEKTSARSSG